MTDKILEMIRTVNMFDTVIYDNTKRTGPMSLRKGTVSFISRRGINVSTDSGDTFIKWTHVKEIIKGEKMKRKSGTKEIDQSHKAMSKYIVFAYDFDCKCGGLNDILKTYESLNKAESYLMECECYDVAYIVDRDTWRILEVEK